MSSGDRAWWRSAVVYQVYPRSFADSDGDGIGDLRGLRSRLDHLVTLGVDVVWLSPVYRSPQADHGYDVSDYCDIDPTFGTLADLDGLLVDAHARGLKLVMDLVVNHTSDEHPWFVESRSSRDSPKRDWYLWRDGRDGGEPNNWGSLFGGSAWAWDERTEQYYLHLFDRKQPDLNWENPEVRAAVHAMMRWWLDRGVDGFRMDVINFISKAAGLPDAAPVAGHRFVDPKEHFVDGPHVHDYLAEMSEAVFAGREGQFLTVGETPGVSLDQAVLYTDPGRREVDMVFQFEHVEVDQGPGGKFDPVDLDRAELKRSLHRWQSGLADVGWNSLYWNNHDQPRAVSRFGDDDPAYWAASAKALGTILHGLRGTPFVYQGEEIGMTNYPFASPEEYRDVESLNHCDAVLRSPQDPAAALRGLARVSRDNARTPVQWDASPHAGFTTGTPWLAVNPNHAWLNVAAQAADPHSVLAHYRELIRLRHELPVLAHGDVVPLLEDDPTVWAYTRTWGGQRLLVVAHCDRRTRTVELPGWAGAELLLGTLPGTPRSLDADSVTLAGWDARIYRAGGEAPDVADRPTGSRVAP